jgi:UDP-3-O-[3-hydroxymyristoyl] glucosamine N-acyltransferase
MSEDLSKLKKFDNMRGLFHRTPEGAYVANNAIVCGDVRLAKNSNIWFGCVIRGDDEPITIGENSNIQDLSCIHVDYGCPTVIGANVTVGHKAMIHGCTIEEDALIGMGATLLNGCVIGAGGDCRGRGRSGRRRARAAARRRDGDPGQGAQGDQRGAGRARATWGRALRRARSALPLIWPWIWPWIWIPAEGRRHP